MLVLGIDTATPRVVVALGSAGELLGELQLAAAQRHAEVLVPAIRYLCDASGVQLDQLAAIGVGIGPGLFTGLRVGVATAKMMAQVLHVPVVGVPTPDLVAYPLRHTTRVVVVVMDARRREVYDVSYRPVPGGLQRSSEYRVRPPADLVAELAAGTDELLLAGDGVARYRDDLCGLDHAEIAGPCFDAPSAAELVAITTARAEREDFEPPWELSPLYLRRSDAEIEWERVGR
jgi:tRNA threonylcarbamoyladenosine biosynthesis protein TsaB